MCSLTRLSASFILSKATLNGTFVTFAPSICVIKIKHKKNGRPWYERISLVSYWPLYFVQRFGLILLLKFQMEILQSQLSIKSRPLESSDASNGWVERILRASLSHCRSKKKLAFLSGKIPTLRILSPGPMTLFNKLPLLTAVMKIPGSPGTTGLSRPPLIFNPSLPIRPVNRMLKLF